MPMIIFAQASSLARSALHIHRISGSGCIEQLCKTLGKASAQNEQLRVDTINPRHAYYLNFYSKSGKVIDDVVVTFYKGTHSYTGEDSAEITSHGNPLLSSQIQSRLRDLGFNDAKPGEFTQRAYLNGKLDLTQAEAVSALIEANTFGGIELARESAQGKVAQVVKSMRTAIISLRAQIEARIDFSEEEVGTAPWELIHQGCERIAKQLKILESTFDKGKRIQEGLKISLIGAPNAGKSSLYNALLAEDAAIVSDEMGTTRDVLRERFVLKNRDFVLADTAGIRSNTEASGPVELKGIERTFKEGNTSDVLLIVIDLSRYRNSALEEMILFVSADYTQLLSSLDLTSGQEVVLVLNKIDLLKLETHSKLKSSLEALNVRTVCTNHLEVSELEEALCALYDSILNSKKVQEQAENGNNAILISVRQRDQVRRALESMQRAVELCQKKAYLEVIASEIIECENALVDLLGRVDIDEIFQEIFSNFCIGK